MVIDSDVDIPEPRRVGPPKKALLRYRRISGLRRSGVDASLPLPPHGHGKSNILTVIFPHTHGGQGGFSPTTQQVRFEGNRVSN